MHLCATLPFVITGWNHSYNSKWKKQRDDKSINRTSQIEYVGMNCKLKKKWTQERKSRHGLAQPSFRNQPGRMLTQLDGICRPMPSCRWYTAVSRRLITYYIYLSLFLVPLCLSVCLCACVCVRCRVTLLIERRLWSDRLKLAGWMNATALR